MNTATPVPVDMAEELRQTTHHLCGMLRTHLRLAGKDSPAGKVSAALLAHLKGLTPAALGLPQIDEHAARIEAAAADDARAEDLGYSAARTRSA